MVGWARRVVVGLVLAAPVVVLGAWFLLDDNSDGGGADDALPISLDIGVAPVDVDLAGDIDADLPAEGTVWRFEQPDDGVVAELEAVLGVALDVAPDGSFTGGGGVDSTAACTPGDCEPTAAAVEGATDALALIAGVSGFDVAEVTSAGTEVGGALATLTAGWSGTPTAGPVASVLVDAEGRVRSAMGFMGEIEEIGAYRLIGLDEALDRVRSGRTGLFPGQVTPVVGPATTVPGPAAAPAAVVAATPALAFAEGSDGVVHLVPAVRFATGGDVPLITVAVAEEHLGGVGGGFDGGRVPPPVPLPGPRPVPMPTVVP